MYWLANIILFILTVTIMLAGVAQKQITMIIVGCLLLIALGISVYKTTKATLENKQKKEKKEYQKSNEAYKPQITATKTNYKIEPTQRIQTTKREKQYTKKTFLTNCEKEFYKKLITATKELNVIVREQIPLGSVVDKTNKEEYRNELNRIIDFGIFDNDFNLLLLIELNDKSHERLDRQARDARVKAICEDAEIKIITFYTKYSNEIDYIKQKITSLL